MGGPRAKSLETARVLHVFGTWSSTIGGVSLCNKCVTVWVCLETLLLSAWNPGFCLPLEHDVEHSEPRCPASLEAAVPPTIILWTETHKH